MSYNAQLVRDAKTRLPYVDAQTGIAQDHSHLMQSRLNRKRGVLPGQVFSYPQRRWRRETRPVLVVQRGETTLTKIFSFIFEDNFIERSNNYKKKFSVCKIFLLILTRMNTRCIICKH